MPENAELINVLPMSENAELIAMLPNFGFVTVCYQICYRGNAELIAMLPCYQKSSRSLLKKKKKYIIVLYKKIKNVYNTIKVIW